MSNRKTKKVRQDNLSKKAERLGWKNINHPDNKRPKIDDKLEILTKEKLDEIRGVYKDSRNFIIP